MSLTATQGQGRTHDVCLAFHAFQMSTRPPGLYGLIYDGVVCVHLPFTSELYEADLEQASTLVPLHANPTGVLADHTRQTDCYTWGA